MKNKKETYRKPKFLEEFCISSIEQQQISPIWFLMIIFNYFKSLKLTKHIPLALHPESNQKQQNTHIYMKFIHGVYAWNSFRSRIYLFFTEIQITTTNTQMSICTDFVYLFFFYTQFFVVHHKITLEFRFGHKSNWSIIDCKYKHFSG